MALMLPLKLDSEKPTRMLMVKYLIQPWLKPLYRHYNLTTYERLFNRRGARIHFYNKPIYKTRKNFFKKVVDKLNVTWYNNFCVQVEQKNLESEEKND